MKSSKKKREALIKFSEWQTKAEDDYIAIEAMLKEEGLPNPICFHAQQMAGKVLKTEGDMLQYKSYGRRYSC